jgi:hypothetical protein
MKSLLMQGTIHLLTYSIFQGLLAKAKFHVSYRGKTLSKALQQVLSNSLRYFLRRPTTEDASF